MPSFFNLCCATKQRRVKTLFTVSAVPMLSLLAYGVVTADGDDTYAFKMLGIGAAISLGICLVGLLAQWLSPRLFRITPNELEQQHYNQIAAQRDEKSEGIEVPLQYICPISQMIMLHPAYVIDSPCQTRYEESMLEKWVLEKGTHPETRALITGDHKIKRDDALAQEIQKFVTNNHLDVAEVNDVALDQLSLSNLVVQEGRNENGVDHKNDDVEAALLADEGNEGRPSYGALLNP